MRPRNVLAVLGVLASAALVVGLMGPEFAKADKRGGIVVRAGDAVVEGADARIEGGPTVEGARARAGDEGGSDKSGGSGVGATAEPEQSTSVKDGEAVLSMKGDEGVEFSGTCSVGGEEHELKGRVPEEFTFALNGDELKCEVRKEGGDGTLKLVLVSGNNRIVQRASGDSTMKLAYSGNGGSSSSSSVSGSSNVVTQSSSSVVQSNSSSTGD